MNIKQLFKSIYIVCTYKTFMNSVEKYHKKSYGHLQEVEISTTISFLKAHQNKPEKSTAGCAGLAVLFLLVKFRFSKKATNI